MKKYTICSLMVFLATLSAFASEGELKVGVDDSGSPKIDRLVTQLISSRPAPIATGGEVPGVGSAAYSLAMNEHGRYSTKEVEVAITAIMKLGPKFYPQLIKHWGDDRYCYSEIGPHGSPTMSGWTNRTVGDAVYLVFANDISWLGGYKMRVGADGKHYPAIHFRNYIESQGGMEKWVTTVASMPRAKIDLAFIAWCIAKEKSRGFKNKESEKHILERYLTKKKEVEQGGASDR